MSNKPFDLHKVQFSIKIQDLFIMSPYNSVTERNMSLGSLILVIRSETTLYLFRKAFPKALSLRKGFLGSTTKALPGTTPSFSPYITAMKPSVVGSGPILMPGKSCSSRYLQEEQTERSLTHITLITRFMRTCLSMDSHLVGASH